MCLTLPARIKEMNGDIAAVVYSGREIKVKTALVPDAKAGDWVLINANLAIKKISPKEAKEINQYYEK